MPGVRKRNLKRIPAVRTRLVHRIGPNQRWHSQLKYLNHRDKTGREQQVQRSSVESQRDSVWMWGSTGKVKQRKSWKGKSAVYGVRKADRKSWDSCCVIFLLFFCKLSISIRTQTENVDDNRKKISIYMIRSVWLSHKAAIVLTKESSPFSMGFRGSIKELREDLDLLLLSLMSVVLNRLSWFLTSWTVLAIFSRA